MPKRLLVVDDQLDTILFLKDRLEGQGYEISTAANGEEGLQMIETQKIDGILLDLEMPVMDGLTMLKHLRKQFPQTPVIVMSTDPTGSPMAEAIVNGAQDYLFKPILSETLISKCRQLFE